MIFPVKMESHKVKEENMRILYLDCFSGISGDMTLASLVHAGADRDYIESELRKMDIEPFRLEWKTVVKQGVSATKVDVVTDTHPDGHEHAHGHHKHTHDHHQEHEHDKQRDHHEHHSHEHAHGHGHIHSHHGDHHHHDHHHHAHHGGHHHRNYAEIVRLIEAAGFNDRVTKMSLAIFEKIAQAEAKIHHLPLEKVHFHEVGAIDSIVDIVGVALALDSLNIDRIISSPVPLGSGKVKCAHGIYPVPAPATLEIMKGIPLAPSHHAVELTTPTGAGIVAALAEEFSPSFPPLIVESIGYGAGTRDLPGQPNVLRTVIGEKREYRLRSPIQMETLPGEQPAGRELPHHHDKH